MKIHSAKIKAARLLKKIKWFDYLWLSFTFVIIMLTRFSLAVKACTAILIMLALCCLSTANFLLYGVQLQKQAGLVLSVPAEEQQEGGGGSQVPDPAEEKSSDTLQHLSEYLHSHHLHLVHPVAIQFFGNRHDILNYPIHHFELITPPPKAML